MAGSGRWRYPKGWSKAKTQLPGKLGWVSGWEEARTSWQESTFPGMSTAERKLLRECNCSRGGLCPVLTLRPDVGHSSLHCVVKKWNRSVSLLSYLSTFLLTPNRRENFMEWGHYFLKVKNNLFTPSSIPFTLLIDCAVVTTKKKVWGTPVSLCWSWKIFWTET